MKAKKKDKREAKETGFLLAQVFFFLKRKSVKKGFLAAALVILVFTVFVAPVSATVYDFKDTVNNKAYEGYDDNKPADVPPDYEVELSGDEYHAINTSDNNRASYAKSGMPEGQYEFHRFKFKINELISDISQLYVMHEGYGSIGGQTGLHFYVWNYTASEWDEVNYNLAGSDTVIDKTYTSGFSNYINASGYLQLLAETRFHASSCPFLYAWNGTGFAFIADFNTPGGLGYYDASAGKPYVSKPKDYVKIDGSQLEAVNGTYRLEIAEDQDEVVYLDGVKLLVVDHPQGTEIYTPTMTKFAEPYPFKVYTIKDPKLPVSAVDENGADILPIVSEVDRIYTEGKDFHWDTITVDFGDLSEAKEIKLLYNAYIEWPLAPGIAARYMNEEYRVWVEVINEDGEWENVSIEEPLGLPQATPRTVAINITDWFKTDDYRIRIHSYENIKIDYIAVDTTEDEEVIITELDPISADIHFKGVAKEFSQDGKRPYLADYYITVDASGFEPFVGNFTRYGDVLPLLTKVDDKFVIMHAGDDISLAFNEVAIPEGMERDYYLLSGAYYKLHFVRILLNESESRVDPLPFHNMSYYPYPENESYPYDAEHLAYLQEYNTRKFNILSSKSEHNTIYTDYVKVEVFQKPVHNQNTGEYFSTIQAAINDDGTLDGHTIVVDPETYRENVVINKSITLKAGSSPVIDGMGGIGITVEANDTVVQDMTVINSSIGIFVYNASFIIQNATLNNNTIYDCIYSPGNGIEFWDVNNSVINGSYIYNNSLDGIHIVFSSNNNITSNEIYNNSKGIYMSSSNNNTIDTNNVSYNINCGIELGPFTPNSYNNISNNNVHHNGQYGIYFHFFEEYNNIYKNTISNHSYGIFMEHVDNNNLTSNTIFSNNYGIYLNASSNHDIIGNNVYNNTEDGIYLAFLSNYNTIADNTVWNNNNGIALSVITLNNYNNIINNTVNSNTKYGIYLKNGERHNNITDNTVSENEVGICLEDAHHNLVKDNDVVDNKHGIWVNQSSNNTIEWNMIVNNTGGATGMNVTNLSTNNEIHSNCFIDNKPYQAWDDVQDGNNDWDSNYWSDYPQWGEYDIPGTAGSKDHSTLKECGGSLRPARVPAPNANRNNRTGRIALGYCGDEYKKEEEVIITSPTSIF